MGNSSSAEQAEADEAAGDALRSLSESGLAAARARQQHQLPLSQRDVPSAAQSASRPRQLSLQYSHYYPHVSPHPSISASAAQPFVAAPGQPGPPPLSASRTALGLRPADSVALAPVLSTHTSSVSAASMGNNQSRPPGHGISSPAARPVNIPDSGASRKQQQPPQLPLKVPDEALLPILPIGPPPDEQDSYLLSESEFTRPPRLPLPIDEVHTEGSPLLSPADLGLDAVALGPGEGDFPLVSRASELSNTTADDDDIGDDLGTVRGGVLPSVPTKIEWSEPGNKVYVTGTFADWDRKYRLIKR
jgi:Glycogen recognition site of AMP-activated protein kinase